MLEFQFYWLEETEFKMTFLWEGLDQFTLLRLPLHPISSISLTDSMESPPPIQ